jgi:hypothetical protein
MKRSESGGRNRRKRRRGSGKRSAKRKRSDGNGNVERKRTKLESDTRRTIQTRRMMTGVIEDDHQHPRGLGSGTILRSREDLGAARGMLGAVEMAIERTQGGTAADPDRGRQRVVAGTIVCPDGQRMVVGRNGGETTLGNEGQGTTLGKDGRGTILEIVGPASDRVTDGRFTKMCSRN